MSIILPKPPCSTASLYELTRLNKSTASPKIEQQVLTNKVLQAKRTARNTSLSSHGAPDFATPITLIKNTTNCTQCRSADRLTVDYQGYANSRTQPTRLYYLNFSSGF